MPDQSTEMEKKMIEFATKTAHTIQTQAGQIQALSHALLISLVAIGEHNEPFKKDFVNRIEMISDHLSDKPVDQFTKEYFDEIVRFLSDPYHYSKTEETDRW